MACPTRVLCESCIIARHMLGYRSCRDRRDTRIMDRGHCPLSILKPGTFPTGLDKAAWSPRPGTLSSDGGAFGGWSGCPINGRLCSSHLPNPDTLCAGQLPTAPSSTTIERFDHITPRSSFTVVEPASRGRVESTNVPPTVLGQSKTRGTARLAPSLCDIVSVYCPGKVVLFVLRGLHADLM